jgi:hypothetical protein
MICEDMPLLTRLRCHYDLEPPAWSIARTYAQASAFATRRRTAVQSFAHVFFR